MALMRSVEVQSYVRLNLDSFANKTKLFLKTYSFEWVHPLRAFILRDPTHKLLTLIWVENRSMCFLKHGYFEVTPI